MAMVRGGLRVRKMPQSSLKVRQNSTPELVLASPAVPASQGCHGPDQWRRIRLQWQQGRDVWQFLEQAWIAHHRGGVMLSLLPDS